MVCLAPRAPGDSVRPGRLSGVVVRPLKFTVRSPRMTPSEGQLRVVSICYAILCVACVAIALILASSAWQGSWSRLVADLAMLGGGFWVVLVGLTLLNGGMSVLAFRFLKLNNALRTVALSVAVLFMLWRIAILMSQLLSKQPIASPLISPSLGWVGNILLAVGYSMCAYTLWSAPRTSNHRWSGL